MGHIAIKDDILARLTELAREHGVPLEQQTERLLLQAMGPAADPVSIKRRLAEIAAMTPEGIAQTDSTLLLRQDRDR